MGLPGIGRHRNHGPGFWKEDARNPGFQDDFSTVLGRQNQFNMAGAAQWPRRKRATAGARTKREMGPLRCLAGGVAEKHRQQTGDEDERLRPASKRVARQRRMLAQRVMVAPASPVMPRSEIIKKISKLQCTALLNFSSLLR